MAARGRWWSVRLPVRQRVPPAVVVCSVTSFSSLESLFHASGRSGRWWLPQGELPGLHWEDVDLEADTLRVRRSLSRTTKAPILAAPKSPRAGGASTPPHVRHHPPISRCPRQIRPGTTRTRDHLHCPRHLFSHLARHGRRPRGCDGRRARIALSASGGVRRGVKRPRSIAGASPSLVSCR